jgi:hypothetical protein
MATPAGPAPEQPELKDQAQLPTQPPLNGLAGVWAHLRSRVPWKIVAAALLVATVAFAGWKTFFPASSATLVVRGQHSFRAAELSVWVDGDLVHHSQLVGTVKKHFGLLESVQGSFAQSLPVPEGEHTIRVELAAPSEGFEQSKEVQAKFVANAQQTLTVIADKRSGNLYLALRDEGAAAPLKSSATAPVFGKLLASLLLTIAGSVLSAAVGFMVQERLKMIREKKTKP